MNFWKRKKPKAADSPSIRRKQYRARPNEELNVKAFVFMPSGEQLPAEIVDVSVTGASMRLSVDWDPVLAKGDVIELSVGIEGRKPVKTPGEVMFSGQDGDRHTRYGFRYTNPGNLYAQLDEQYARLFNRRGTFRAAATLTQRIPIHLSWQGFILDTVIHDVSDGGVGVLFDKRQSVMFGRAKKLRASFRLEPKGPEYTGELEIVHRTEVADGSHLFGMRFLFEQQEGFGQHKEAIKAFVKERNQEIEGWEGSWRFVG